MIGTGGTRYLEIFASSGSVDFYVDSVVLIKSEYMAMEDVFVPHSSRKMLWEKAVEILRDINVPKTVYDVGFFDLYEHDSTTYVDDEFLSGDDITLQDQTSGTKIGLGIDVTVRCTKKTWNLLKPWECRGEFESA